MVGTGQKGSSDEVSAVGNPAAIDPAHAQSPAADVVESNEVEITSPSRSDRIFTLRPKNVTQTLHTSLFDNYTHTKFVYSETPSGPERVAYIRSFYIKRSDLFSRLFKDVNDYRHDDRNKLNGINYFTPILPQNSKKSTILFEPIFGF
jgi:hypothetical protein